MNLIVAYDISDDRARARVAALLSSVGLGVQHSVFECVVPNDEIERLVDRLRHLVDEERDVVQLFVQCGTCQAARIDVGQARLDLEELCWVV